jgi:hypothetical protein
MKGMAHAVSVFDGVESATKLSFSKHYHKFGSPAALYVEYPGFKSGPRNQLT